MITTAAPVKIHDFQDREKALFAAWLAEELAPTLCGSKPATILTLSDTKKLKLFRWWGQYGEAVMAETPVRYIIMADQPGRNTILFYRRDLLEDCLTEPERRDFFRQLGYPVEQGLEDCLAVLKRKFADGCPHEIGLFLGIPLRDVLGFMGFSGEPLACRSHWCIFGDPAQSLTLIEQHNADKGIVQSLLSRGFCPLAMLAGGGVRSAVAV